MKRFTGCIVTALAMLAIIMAITRAFEWRSFSNNLVVGLVCALLTVSVVHWLVAREQRELEGLWASEAIFLETVDVGNMVRDAARFLIADMPSGVEADEQWVKLAKGFSLKRQRLGFLLPKDMHMAVVELEDELKRADIVTARGEESRKAYAKQVVGIWRRYRHLMDRMLKAGDHDLRKDLMPEPPELIAARERYGLDELGLETHQGSLGPGV